VYDEVRSLSEPTVFRSILEALLKMLPLRNMLQSAAHKEGINPVIKSLHHGYFIFIAF